jgi:hypothetical protein
MKFKIIASFMVRVFPIRKLRPGGVNVVGSNPEHG